MEAVALEPIAQEPRQIGRRTVWQPETEEKFLGLLVEGLSRKAACQAIGISQETLYARLRDPRQSAFLERVRRAEAENEAALTRQVLAHAAKDWRAAGFLLKCRHAWTEKQETQHNHLHVHGSAGQFAALLGAGNSDRSIDIEADVEGEQTNPPQSS
jgi:hypothetical protein